MKSPAATSSAIDSAIWLVASAGAEARRGAGARRLPGVPLQHADQIGPSAVQRRIEPEDDAGGQRQRQRVEQHAAIDRRRESSAAASGGSSAAMPLSVQRDTSSPARPPSSASVHDSTSSWREHLAAAGANRQPHRHLAGAAGGAGQQQVGDVGAGDQQHDAVTPSSSMSGARASSRTSLWPRGPALERERLGAEALHRLVAHARLQRRFDVGDDGRGRARRSPRRLLDRHAGLEPREQVGPVAAAILEAPSSPGSSVRASSGARTRRAGCRASCPRSRAARRRRWSCACR